MSEHAIDAGRDFIDVLGRTGADEPRLLDPSTAYHCHHAFLNFISIAGASGSLLCIGSAKASFCDPFLFQNYQQRMIGPEFERLAKCLR